MQQHLPEYFKQRIRYLIIIHSTLLKITVLKVLLYCLRWDPVTHLLTAFPPNGVGGWSLSQLPLSFEVVSGQVISGPGYMPPSQFTYPANACLWTTGGQNPHGRMGEHGNSTHKSPQTPARFLLWSQLHHRCCPKSCYICSTCFLKCANKLNHY